MAGWTGIRPWLSSTACKNARNASAPSAPSPSNFLEHHIPGLDDCEIPRKASTRHCTRNQRGGPELKHVSSLVLGFVPGKQNIGIGGEKTPSKKGTKASSATPGSSGKLGKGAPKTPMTPKQAVDKRSPKPRSAKGCPSAAGWPHSECGCTLLWHTQCRCRGR